MKIEVVDNVEIVTSYFLVFNSVSSPSSGYSFPCDENGNLIDMNELALENYRKCLSREFDVVPAGIEKYVSTTNLCSCGSGLHPEEVFDGHGIFLMNSCDSCYDERIGGFRHDIFADYECDEQIDDDY